MTRDKIDILWNKALQDSVAAGETFTRYNFYDLIVAEVQEEMAQLSKLEAEVIQLRKMKFAADELLEAREFVAEIWKARVSQLEQVVLELEQEVLAEREACALLCDHEADEFGGMSDGFYAAKNCAVAIRARGGE